MKLNTVIYWVRSNGPAGKDRVPMYFRGRCRRASEGEVGYDVQARPTRLGVGRYVGVYGGGDFEDRDGNAINFANE